MDARRSDMLRCIPSVDSLLAEFERQGWAAGAPRRLVVEAVRAAVEQTRELLLAGQQMDAGEEEVAAAVVARARERLRALSGPHYRRVINATGIILHTGLGRAVLPRPALQQIERELSGYSLLQLGIHSGKRSRRDERIEWLLQQLTGAEAATVVNNNAAATLLVLSAIAAGKEVIVSRGQLVEIGGSFRLPEVMAASGARLVEVGTTNRTHLRDYENAICENTAAILRVHPSNYRIVGFTSEVSLPDLVRVAHEAGLVLMDDVGAGSLIDFSRLGFAPEPNLPASIAAGADLVTSSADKLIGACQGGIILGRRDLVEAARRNPLARAVRVGKLNLAALEATLTLFLDEGRALQEVPTLRMALRSRAEIAEQAERMAAALIERASGLAEISVQDGASQMGSGSLPEQDLPTCLVAISPCATTPGELALRLRQNEPPVFTRIQDEKVLIDPRTLQEGEERTVVEAAALALTQRR